MSVATSNPLHELAAPGVLATQLGRLLHRWYRLTGSIRGDRPVLEWVNGLAVLVLPGVFNPLRMRTGAFFAGLLDDRQTRDREVLDLGTGSGICALAAARAARHVVATDINGAAAACARINAAIHQLEEKIEVLHGDLFAPVASRRFDLVLFNPPFLRGQPADDADRAWRSTDVAARFARQLRLHLNPGGHALVLLSSFGGAADFLDALGSGGYRIATHATRRYFNETIVVFRVTPAVP